MISAETTTPSYISSKGVQFTIRLDEKINNGIVGKAKEMDVTRAELIRVALESYLETQMSSNQNSDTEGILLDQLEHVQKELAEKNEQISELLKQQNQNQQIIMSMNQNQKLLVEAKRTWLQRLFGVNVENA